MDSPLLIDTRFAQITDANWRDLFALAKKVALTQKKNDLFNGQKINTSEQRPALHTALRNISETPVMVEDVDVMPNIAEVWRQMDQASNQLLGVTDIIHIGIGGSDFGPRLVCDALRLSNTSEKPSIRVHFLSNVDSADLANILEKVKPLSTRLILVSKAFTTVETLQNASAVINWLIAKGIKSAQISKMIYAVTANPKLAKQFGVMEKNIFPFWDWVGGRFSVWSAVGLPIALQFGFKTYQDFLAGAHAMDQHFLKSEDQHNQALQLGLALYFHQKQHGVKSQAIIPYAQSLQLFPNWLQQLEMESNGKTAGLDGQPVPFSAPVIFGIPGTNAQHSFFQMLHQGPEIIPVDFIAVRESMSNIENHHSHHEQLLANCLAQSQAFAIGQGHTTDLNHYYPGKRPNNIIWLPRLDAFHLGALMALYEHRTFCLGLLYGINSFDQPGVELGKKLAVPIQSALSDPQSDLSHLNPVTADRIMWLKNTPSSS
jgi:glucose-6-phosphate isomerase